MKIATVPFLLCLVACGQQNSDLGKSVGVQSATPEPTASLRQASAMGQETAHEDAIRKILERNLPNLSDQERQEVYRNEVLTDRPTQRGFRISKDIALFVARNKAPSRYGPEYDRLEREARVNSINKAEETGVDIQSHKAFENDAEREDHIENQFRQREIRWQQQKGRALTEQEKDFLRSTVESDTRQSEEDLKKYQEEVAQSAAPRVLPYTDAAGRAAYVRKKQEELLEKHQALTGGAPVSAEQRRYLLSSAEVVVQQEEAAQARK